jgi:hypothetical protein
MGIIHAHTPRGKHKHKPVGKEIKACTRVHPCARETREATREISRGRSSCAIHPSKDQCIRYTATNKRTGNALEKGARDE